MSDTAAIVLTEILRAVCRQTEDRAVQKWAEALLQRGSAASEESKDTKGRLLADECAAKHDTDGDDKKPHRLVQQKEGHP